MLPSSLNVPQQVLIWMEMRLWNPITWIKLNKVHHVFDFCKECGWVHYECTWAHQSRNKKKSKRSYTHSEKEITSILDEIDDACDNELVEESDIVQLGDVVVDRVETQNTEKCISDVGIFFGWNNNPLVLHLSTTTIEHFVRNNLMSLKNLIILL